MSAAPWLALLSLAGASVACAQGISRADSGAFDGARAWSELEQIVACGERPAGSQNLERLRRHITDELEALGLEPVREAFRAVTPRGEIDFANLFVEIPAGEPADSRRPLVVIGTHMDTKSGLSFEFVGANDGGSGTAVLLELVRCLSVMQTRVVYRLVFFDGEEAVRPKWAGTDNCYGSRQHVRQLQQVGQLERVAAFILLDMVGDKDLRLTRELNSDPERLAIFSAAARALGLEQHVGADPQEISDDHLSFLQVGVPSVDLIDFEYGPENGWWHTQEDRLDKCSPESLSAIGRIVLAGLPRIEELALQGAP